MSTFLVNCAGKPFPSKINSSDKQNTVCFINMADNYFTLGNIDDILCQALTTK